MGAAFFVFVNSVNAKKVFHGGRVSIAVEFKTAFMQDRFVSYQHGFFYSCYGIWRFVAKSTYSYRNNKFLL